MEPIGQSHRSAHQSRRSLIPSALQPSKLWSRLQDSYSQWRDRREAAVHAADLEAHVHPGARVRMRMRARARNGQGFGLEAVEPRLLLSADLSYTAAGAGDVTLRMDDVDGVETVRLVDSVDSSVVYGSIARADLDGSAGYGVRVDSAGFDVTLRIDASVESASLAGGIQFVGGSGVDTLVGSSLDSLWTISGEGSGQVGSVSFSGVENLQGASGNHDTFVLGEMGGLSGVMDGGVGGFDTLVLDGGDFSSVMYRATDGHSGVIERDGQTLNYQGLEPIIDSMVVADRVISTSSLDDEATLTDNGDGTLTLASASVVPTFESITFVKPSSSLTIQLGADLALPFLSEDVLTVVSLDAAGMDLTIQGEEGQDRVVFSGTVTAGDIVVNAERITVSGTVNAGLLNLTASDSDGGAVDAGGNYLGGVFQGLYIATPEAVIDLSGANITASGAVILSATATTNVSAIPSTLGSTLDATVITALPTAHIVLNNTTLSAASVVAASAVSATVAFVDEADGSDTDTSSDAAVTVLVLISDSTTAVEGTSTLSVSGNLALTASTLLDVKSQADGSGGSAGATLAVTEVQAHTAAYVSGTSSIGALAGNTPDSITVSANLTSTVETEAISTAGGAQDGSGTNQSELRLNDPNKDGNTGDQAETSGGSINFAGAVAVTDYRPVTEAYVSTGGSLLTAGVLNVSAMANESVVTRADGSNTGDGGTGVGVAVAIGVVDSTVSAYVGGVATLDASEVSVGAVLDADNTYEVEATSGSGDGTQTGVAGSLAVNVVSTLVSARVLSGASLDLQGASLDLSATSATHAITHAVPHDSGTSSDLGIGASVAVAVMDNVTEATIESHADVLGAENVTLEASGSHVSDTLAEAGGKGSTGLGGAFAIDVIDNTTRATLGSDVDALDISGDFSALATHHGLSSATASGTALGDQTAVGAAIALAFVDNRATASTSRHLRADRSVSLGAHADGSSAATATASAAGADKDDKAGSGNASADDQVGGQTSLANSKSGDGDAVGQSADDGSGSGGSVGVAAALAVNVSSAVAQALVGEGTTVVANDDGVAGGSLGLSASNNMDAQAVADGSAAEGSMDTAVGVAVAINVADMDNEALVLGSADVGGQGLGASAGMKDVGGDTKHKFGAKATSGASGSDTGVAGSFALNVSDANTMAGLRDGSEADAGTGDVSLSTASETETDVQATGNAVGANVGVGVSIAVNVVDNSTQSLIEDNAVLTGGHDVTLSATGSHTTSTLASSGGQAADGTGVGGSFAITVADNTTQATVGTGTALDISGDFSATATHHGVTTTTANGDALGGSTAVGAAIALSFVDDTALAGTLRGITADGSVSFVALADGSSTATATASAAGASKEEDTDGDGDNTNDTADKQVGKQTMLANDKSGDGDAVPQTADDGSGSGGSVGVAAALALNVASAKAEASILGVGTLSTFGRLRPGMVGNVTPEGGATYKATIKVVDRVLDAASGTYGVRLELANPQGQLPGGSRCQVDFPDLSNLAQTSQRLLR